MNQRPAWYIALSILLVLISTFFGACRKPSILTEEERAWLKNNPDINVGITPLGPPFEFINEDGEIVGMFIDFLEIIEKRINYRFEREYYSDFQNVLMLLRNGEIDIMLEMQSTPERLSYMRFTPPLANYPHVIIVRANNEHLKNLNNLKGKKVVVVDQCAIHEHLRNNYPQLNVGALKNDIECLRAVSGGEMDAFIGQQAVVIYLIEKEGISNLRISGEMDYCNKLGIASRKDLPMLNQILTKGVNSISKKERAEVYNNWLSYTKATYSRRLELFYYSGSVIMIILLLMLFFNVMLRKKVKQRTLDLMEAKDKAEEADRLKSTFLANMSHEIRTPMNAISGFGEILYGGGLDGNEVEMYSEIIYKNSIHLLHLIDDVIDFSKLEANQVSIVERPFSLNKLFAQLKANCDAMLHTAEKEMIRIEVNHGLEDGKDVIVGDETRLMQVLTNLVNNAIKFTPKGSVTVGYRLHSDEQMQFYVEDTGIGIAEEFQKDIFQRFVQVKNDDTLHLSGTGLGLTICNSLVEMMGGRIHIQSELGVGSVFSFQIPVKQLEVL